MGADYFFAFARSGRGFTSHRSAVPEKPVKTCTRCGQGGLKWGRHEDGYGGWRLFSQDNELHTCTRAPVEFGDEPV